MGTLHADYVRTARSKGLAQRLVVLRHALPNAILPVITIAAMDLGQLLGGIVVVEAVFSWPGIGLQAYQALQNLAPHQDSALLQAVGEHPTQRRDEQHRQALSKRHHA